MANTPRAAKALPPNPSIEYLRKQAKDLVGDNPSLKLAAAQHKVAKEYGFTKWADLARAVREKSGDDASRTQILCQHCGQTPAVVHTSVVIAGKTFEKHFCARCAQDPSVQLMEAPPVPTARTPAVLKPFIMAAKGAQTRLVIETIQSEKFRTLVRDLLLRPLALTSEQQSKVRSLWGKAAKTFIARSDMPPGQTEWVEEFGAAAKAAYREFLSILTPEQMEIFLNIVLPPAEPPERRPGS